MAIYMKYAAIDGTVTTDGFAKWIEVGSFQMGIGRGIGSPVGGSTNREASHASVSEITITKTMDDSTPKLFLESLSGELKNKVEIKFVRTKPGATAGVVPYLEFELTDTAISGYSQSSGGDAPSESLSLNFAKIQMKHTPMKEDGTVGTPLTQSYDLGKQVAS